MSISYGYCGLPSVSWKVKYTPTSIMSCVDGKSCVTLVKSVKEVTPNWYEWGDDSVHEALREWLEIIKCDHYGHPNNASIDMQLDEQYRWKPKNSTVVGGQVVNYNSPCSYMQRSRKIQRINLSASVSGRGGINDAMFGWTMVNVTDILSQVGGVELRAGDYGLPDWVIDSCSRERPLDDWTQYSISARGVIGAPETPPPWSSISIALSNIGTPAVSGLSITKVYTYTDQDPTTVDLDSIIETLKERAAVEDCAD